jgi:diaminohydroxyphosphoribosylaminopyrimidine deaminase (EC 3.5.4.26)/5-amino-6-(5-phosphoribosylamino)uracil reductase (EC 1.1.1.193)
MKPFVFIKAAISLDGKIATKTGESQWISNEKSRAYVHQLRAEYDAICVGVQTVILDNPRLTIRQKWRRALTLSTGTRYKRSNTIRFKFTQ